VVAVGVVYHAMSGSYPRAVSHGIFALM
jgi:hypothetical protein